MNVVCLILFVTLLVTVSATPVVDKPDMAVKKISDSFDDKKFDEHAEKKRWLWGLGYGGWGWGLGGLWGWPYFGWWGRR